MGSQGLPPLGILEMGEEDLVAFLLHLQFSGEGNLDMGAALVAPRLGFKQIVR